MDELRHNSPRRNGYLNAVMTAIAVLLALQLVDRHADVRWAEPGLAQAQPPADLPGPGSGLVSDAEWLRLILAETRRIATRAERIEARLNAGLSVKVTEMPAAKPEAKP